MNVVGQVELDPWCRQVLARHWPEVPRHDDVRSAPAWWAAQTRPRVDLVCGGFPCQPFSAAGRRLGLADERWGWPWMRDVVAAVRPRFVLAENVARLLRDTEAFSIILGDLADLGFDVEWSVVSACSLGAPHTRRRLFVLAHPRGQGLEGLHAPTQRVDLQPITGDARRSWPPEPAVDRVADGIPRRLVRDPLQALGNAVVPAVTEHLGRAILTHAHHAQER
ncbi:DNA cytosine methyltransferase [Saccharopolyspora shandongensis]|uniref:DNA cytosine methyltransferase n=1 Tax=Saccharopolyspora shandongensis TaxID=418495 RepID=UPI003421E1DE